MKKIKVNEEINWRGKTQRIGDLLFELLEGVSANDAKEAVRQVQMADELKETLDKKGEWFSYEDANHSVIERVIAEGAKINAPRWIAPIQLAVEAAVSFKGKEGVEEDAVPKSSSK